MVTEAIVKQTIELASPRRAGVSPDLDSAVSLLGYIEDDPATVRHAAGYSWVTLKRETLRTLYRSPDLHPVARRSPTLMPGAQVR